MTALRVEHDVERLSRHVARLSLCCQAMWELIRDNTNLAEEEKLKMLNEDAPSITRSASVRPCTPSSSSTRSGGSRSRSLVRRLRMRWFHTAQNALRPDRAF